MFVAFNVLVTFALPLCMCSHLHNGANIKILTIHALTYSKISISYFIVNFTYKYVKIYGKYLATIKYLLIAETKRLMELALVYVKGRHSILH